MLLFRKKNSKDYVTVSGSAMILHEFPKGEKVTEKISVCMKNSDGVWTPISFNKDKGDWHEKYDFELKDYMMNFIEEATLVDKYKMGVRYE